MAVATYGLVLLAAPLVAQVAVGEERSLPWIPFVGLAIAINATFYVLFRTGLNLRFRDPSLTQQQILVSAAWGMLPLWVLPEARPLILMFYVPPFSFGMLKLDRRRYFVSVGVVMGLYGAMLAIEQSIGRPGIRLSYQLLIYATFGMLILWIAFFGGFVSDLRRRLGRQRRAIQEAHDQLSEEMAARARVAAEKEQLIEELQLSLAKVKKLSGLLPICAACKKVRDDRGYWNQIESYIRSHSEAEFTHGICPDCAAKLDLL